MSVAVLPRRSLLFLAISGGVVPEFWGSSFFAGQERPIATPINLDVIDGQAIRCS